jgi:hypothetical protein
VPGRRLALTLLLAAACSQEPAHVFVPGASFRQSIRLWTDQGERATVGVGDALVLHAQRSSGPWIATERAALSADACWLVAPPEDPEPEVAGNLRWIVEPPGAATFNVDLRLDQTREVRFSKPGVYHVSARSSVWCSDPYGGNTLTVTVVAP